MLANESPLDIIPSWNWKIGQVNLRGHPHFSLIFQRPSLLSGQWRSYRGQGAALGTFSWSWQWKSCMWSCTQNGNQIGFQEECRNIDTEGNGSSAKQEFFTKLVGNLSAWYRQRNEVCPPNFYVYSRCLLFRCCLCVEISAMESKCSKEVSAGQLVCISQLLLYLRLFLGPPWLKFCIF